MYRHWRIRWAEILVIALLELSVVLLALYMRQADESGSDLYMVYRFNSEDSYVDIRINNTKLTYAYFDGLCRGTAEAPCWHEQGLVRQEKILDETDRNSIVSLMYHTNLFSLDEEYGTADDITDTYTIYVMIGKSEVKDRWMTLPEYSKILQEAADMGAIHLEISGEGEPDLPLFRRHLDYIVKEASANGIHTVLFVNGSFTDPSLVKLINENNASLVISTKYMDEAKYEKSVGVRGTYKVAMNNIARAISALGGTHEENGYDIYRLGLNCTTLPDNLEDIKQLWQLCDDNRIFFGLSTRIPLGKLAGTEIDFAGEDALVKEYGHNTLIYADSSIEAIGTPICGTFYYGVGINFDGTVLFDAHATDTAGMIGNVREIGLKGAAEKFRGLRNRFYSNGAAKTYCPLRDPSFSKFVEASKHGNESIYKTS